MHIAVLLATLVICVTSSNTTVSPARPFSFPVFVAQYAVLPLRNVPVSAPVTQKFAVAKFYGDAFASTLLCDPSSVPKILKAKQLAKVTTEPNSMPSLLLDSVSENREVLLNATTSIGLRPKFSLGSFLDTTFVVFCFAFLFNTAIVLLITFLIELNCDVINEKDDEMFSLLVPNQKKTVSLKAPSRNRQSNATMHKAVQVQLNLGVDSFPVICLPKLPTLTDNKKPSQRAAKPNNTGVSPKPLERNPIAGAFNASVISIIKRSIEKRVCRMNMMKSHISANVKKTVASIGNITSKGHNSSDC